jgi:hypothetical protein
VSPCLKTRDFEDDRCKAFADAAGMSRISAGAEGMRVPQSAAGRRIGIQIAAEFVARGCFADHNDSAGITDADAREWATSEIPGLSHARNAAG